MKDKMRIVAMAMLALAAATAFATPSVKIDSVLQRYPWSNTVDIRYTVSGAEAGQTYDVAFSYKVGSGAATGATTNTVSANGSYVAQWTPTAGTRSADCTMFAKILPQSAFEYVRGDYMIVDLVTGEVRYESDDSSVTRSRYNTDEYKTTKMVLRKVPSASGVHLQKNSSQSFNFSHYYYIGIFEVTEAQYKTLVKSGGTSTGDKYPVANVSWEAIRGSTSNFNAVAGVNYAQTSNLCFISRLNKRVSCYGSQGAAMAKFDLPTEAAWEYAASAGTSGTQTYFFGNLSTDLGTYAWNSGNAGSARHPVGEKKANQWGLYDVYGNVREWCRDASYENSSAKDMLSSAFTAVTGGTSALMAYRGGSYDNSSAYMSSIYRNWASKSDTSLLIGFRIAWYVQQ
jgi:formylglycine-generating enzyme required for sulfatase activity